MQRAMPLTASHLPTATHTFLGISDLSSRVVTHRVSSTTHLTESSKLTVQLRVSSAEQLGGVRQPRSRWEFRQHGARRRGVSSAAGERLKGRFVSGEQVKGSFVSRAFVRARARVSVVASLSAASKHYGSTVRARARASVSDRHPGCCKTHHDSSNT